jgi:hypothetical protein
LFLALFIGVLKFSFGVILDDKEAGSEEEQGSK